MVNTRPAEIDTLSAFIPFSECAEDELIVLADHARVVDAPKGHVLAEVGSEDRWDYYLLKGVLRLESADGKTIEIQAGGERARHPVAHLQPRQYTIRAHTAVQYLRVDKALLVSLKYSASGQAKTLEEDEAHHGLSGNPLYAEIYDDLVNDRLVVPSLPDVAVKIRRMIEREDASVPQIAGLVQSDPAISAKLVKVANGALYHGQPAVDSCTQAIFRLGLNTTRHLVVSFVLHNLFEERIHGRLLAERARRLWAHSVEVGAISQVLANVTPGLDPDEALLAGLLHDIGELVILSYAENYPNLCKNPVALDDVIAGLTGELGAVVLQEWCFSESFVTTARAAEDWYRDPAPEPDYCDIVLVAQMHSFVGTPRMASLPHLTEVPAFSKLAHGGLTPEMSMLLLEEAQGQISEVKSLLLG